MDTEMMQSINSGLMISIIGMGVVMCFLVLMMYVMKITEKVMEKLAILFPEEVAEIPASRQSQSNNDSDIAVAIAVAKKFLVKGGN